MQVALAQAHTAAVAARTVQIAAPKPVHWAPHALAGLAGMSAEVRAELALWIGRPMLYIVLMIGLLITGLEQLYVKNVVFGASPVSDYFGLIVWAMSADVASRTISTLK